MPAKKTIAASTTILAGASVIRCVEGANNFNPVEKGESPTSPLGINSQVVQSEDERGKRGESVISDGRLITEEDLGILTPTLEQKMLRRKIQQKKDARSKNKKPQRDPAMEWEDRTSASDVVWGEKDQAVRALGTWGEGSCGGQNCDGLDGTVGAGSCTSYNSCFNLKGTVGNGSCIDGENSCFELDGDVGDGSCIGDSSCFELDGEVGAGSCTGDYSCRGLTGKVGERSCIDRNSCFFYVGDIPDDCPSSSALQEGKCTPSSQPSTAPSNKPSATTSTAPSSQPSTSPVSGQGPDLSRDLCNTLLDEIFDLFLFSNAKEEAIKILVCGVEN